MRTTPDRGAPVAPRATDPQGPPGQPRRPRLEPDDLRPRVHHVLVDLLVLVVLLCVPGLATLLARLLQPTGPASPAVTAVALTAAWLAVVVAFAVVWPHHDGGRTAGMRRAGLRVVDLDGGTPSHGRLLLRVLAAPLDLVVGPWLVLLREDRRQLGDLLAGTRLVHDVSEQRPLPRPRPAPATPPLPRPRPRTPPTPRGGPGATPLSR